MSEIEQDQNLQPEAQAADSGSAPAPETPAAESAAPAEAAPAPPPVEEAPAAPPEVQPEPAQAAEPSAPEEPAARPAEAPGAKPPAQQPPRPPRQGRPQGEPRQPKGQERREGAENREGPRPERRQRQEGGRQDAPRPEGARERGGDRGRERGRMDAPADIDLDKLVSDSLYLDNQAHAIVSRMRDMDSGTRSQLRRLYSAVRRACRAPEHERQHQFVMLRARIAYTIARHQLRSLDSLERLLLQVTRKNDARGYERFRDLFEAIVAYNE
jgi:CRISPR type III-A-associated protein Csm2